MMRMIAMSIAAFVLSWSPYCLVSIIATIRGTNTLTPSEAEVPDLLAKASVIYNPIVYTVMNDRFRATLLLIIPCNSFFSGEVNQRQIPFPSHPGSLSTMPILLLKKEDRRNTRGTFFRSLHCSLVWLTDVKNLEVRLKDKCKGHIPFIFIECATSYANYFISLRDWS